MNSNRNLVGSPVQVVMAAAVETQLDTFRHLTLLDKMALWASWVVAAGIFFTLGWIAMAPDDPYGAVSLLLRRNAVGMWLQAAGLAMVTSAIATILAGRSLPYAGPFAAALGLVVVSLRGRTAESLVIAARASDLGTSGLAAQMGFEALAWVGVMVLSLVIGEGVSRWCLASGAARSDSDMRRQGFPAPVFAVAALAISLLAFNVLGAGMHSREIRHTQVCFVVAASVWLGCYLAIRIVLVRGIFWYVVAVGVMALVGYFWAAIQAGSPNLPVSVPPSNFLRVLPIQFVAAGVAAAIAAYWSNLHHPVEPTNSDAGSAHSEDLGV